MPATSRAFRITYSITVLAVPVTHNVAFLANLHIFLSPLDYCSRLIDSRDLTVYDDWSRSANTG